jgi:hypothetical protein
MNLEDLTIKQARELATMLGGVGKMNSPFLGQHVVLRTENAGVHIGVLSYIVNGEAVLSDARRLWYWKGAFTLSEVATKGVEVNGTRMAVSVPSMQVNGVIEVIPTTEAARLTFAECGE